MKESPVFGQVVECQDGELRSVGRIRCGPDVVEQVSFDYPKSVLSNEENALFPTRLINSDLSGVVCHEVEKQERAWDVVWLVVDRACWTRHRWEAYEGIVYSPTLGKIRALIEKDSMGNRRWDEFKIRSDCIQLKNEYREDELVFLEAPDEALTSVLKRDLPSSLVSQLV